MNRRQFLKSLFAATAVAVAPVFHAARTLKAGEWHHIALVRSGGDIRTFINGKPTPENTHVTDEVREIVDLNQADETLMIGDWRIPTRNLQMTKDFTIEFWVRKPRVVDDVRITKMARDPKDFMKGLEIHTLPDDSLLLEARA